MRGWILMASVLVAVPANPVWAHGPEATSEGELGMGLLPTGLAGCAFILAAASWWIGVRNQRALARLERHE